MRSIPTRLPMNTAIRETRSLCSYCGASWLSGDLRRDGAGLLACPLEGDGLDVVTLGKANAEAARAHRQRKQPATAGPYFDVSNGEGSKPATHHKTRDDVLGV